MHHTTWEFPFELRIIATGYHLIQYRSSVHTVQRSLYTKKHQQYMKCDEQLAYRISTINSIEGYRKVTMFPLLFIY